MNGQLSEYARSFGMALFTCSLLISPAMLVGCAERERALDPAPPNTETEIYREDVENDNVEVEVEREPFVPTQ